MTLLDQITQALDASGALGQLGDAIGASESDTQALLGAGVPAVLARLASHTTNDESAAALHTVAAADGGDLFDSIGSFFGSGDRSGMASTLVGTVFGSQRGAVEQELRSVTGLGLSSITRFLPLITPAVVSLVGKLNGEESGDAAALAALLADTGNGAGAAGDDTAGDGAGAAGDDTAGDGAGAAGDASAEIGDEDRARFMAGLSSLTAAGGLGAVTASGGASADGVAATDVSAAAADDPDRTGLAWLLPALAVFGMLIAGLVLWQCGDSSSDETADVASAEATDATDSGDADAGAVGDDADAADDDAADEDADDDDAAGDDDDAMAELDHDDDDADHDGDDDDAMAELDHDDDADHDADEDAAEPTPQPTPAPVTLGDLATENPELQTLAFLINPLGVAADLADPNAGPFTVFAPTDSAFDAGADVIDRLEDEQLQTTVDYHVVPGIVPASDVVAGATFETLAGETLVVGDDGALPGGIALTGTTLVADNGLIHIVDAVLVPSSVQRQLATSDVNELFALEPIQFASGSAEILPESIPTLDQAVAVLTNVPEGTRFEVQGHTDSAGAAEPNQALSEARAASVVSYLTDNGVDPAMLEARGYGETQLKVDPDPTAEDKAMNRRIEFVDIS